MADFHPSTKSTIDICMCCYRGAHVEGRDDGELVVEVSSRMGCCLTENHSLCNPAQCPWMDEVSTRYQRAQGITDHEQFLTALGFYSVNNCGMGCRFG